MSCRHDLARFLDIAGNSPHCADSSIRLSGSRVLLVLWKFSSSRVLLDRCCETVPPMLFSRIIHLELNGRDQIRFSRSTDVIFRLSFGYMDGFCVCQQNA